MAEFRVPVVIEIMLERVTNIAMGTEIDNIIEFEELASGKADVPTAVACSTSGGPRCPGSPPTARERRRLACDKFGSSSKLEPWKRQTLSARSQPWPSRCACRCSAPWSCGARPA